MGTSVRDRAQRFGNLVYMYGTSNALGTPSVSNAAWCVESWALGADGVVPWQTIGKAVALQKPDDLALFHPTPAGPLPSLRLKTLPRRAAARRISHPLHRPLQRIPRKRRAVIMA